MAENLEIGMLLYPRLTQLDLTGPFEVLSRVPGAKVHLLWKTLDPVRSDRGLAILPSMTLKNCGPLDVLFVPGGPGQVEQMNDSEVLDFLARTGASARYVTSACTGSLILAAAGLLDGYTAACHWLWRDQLAALGVKVGTERVVVDRNRITGGGVTAGIDFAFTLVAMLAGEEAAKAIQLALEYDPAPPFDAGSPERAGEKLVADITRRAAGLRELRDAATRKVQSASH